MGKVLSVRLNADHEARLAELTEDLDVGPSVLALHDLFPTLQEDLRQDVTGYRRLDPTAPKEIRAYDHDWGLKLNVSDAALQAAGQT